MRSMKKLLKKAMVFTLTAAMLVGTPLTASAAPLNSVYSVGDHWGETKVPGEGGDHSHTGTITNTATTTESGVLKDNETKIVGIALDKTHLDMEKGVQGELTATILYDADDSVLVNKYGDEKTDEMKAVLAKMIRWEVQNADGKVDGNTNQTLSIRVKNNGDASTIMLNPRHGTKIGEDMIVKAYLDGSWYIDANGDVQELVDNKTDGYSAKATVFIKEYSDSLSFVGVPEKVYVKNVIDFNKYLVRNPETANDTIIWTSTNTKIAKVSATGVVTFVKAPTGTDTCDIIAIGEKGAKATYTINSTNMEQGTGASKIEIKPASASASLFDTKGKNATLDLGDSSKEQAGVEVTMYAKVETAVKASNNKEAATTEAEAAKKNDKYVTKKMDLADGAAYLEVSKDKKTATPKTVKITDNVTWTTSKNTIAVVADASNSAATIKAAGKALGKANITAKADSGKSAKVAVTVKATLGDLKIGGIKKDDTLYSGQSVQLEAIRTPEANNDAVTWSIEKVMIKGKLKANPNATINAKGVLTIKPKLDASVKEVQINLETKAKIKGTKNPVKKAESVIIYVEQSNITGITVHDDKTLIADLAMVKNKLKANVNLAKKADNTRTLSVPVGKNYTVNATTDATEYDAKGTLNVTSSKPKVATVTYDKNGTARVKAVAKGDATITVSGVANNKVVKTTFKVKVKQPVTSLTMNKTYVVLKDTGKALSASFSVKQNKDAKETITWSMTGTKAGDKNTKIEITNKGKVTFGKDSGYKAGDTYTVTAISQSGVKATATIEIVSPSTAVRVKDKDGNDFTLTPSKGKPKANTTQLALGESVELFPQVNVGKSKPEADQKWIEAGKAEDGKKAAGVTYSVNKKGIVQIVGDTVYRVGNGKAVITIKTTDGKSCKLTIEQ